MENYGVIIRHLRYLAGLSVQQTAKKIDRSTGWLSEVENSSGHCKITDQEFNHIVDILGGTKHQPMFKTWVAAQRTQKVFDGAVLKFIRRRKGYRLSEAARLAELSVSYLSKIETGLKPIDLELRSRIMVAYGYSPSSFKNLSTDPVRSKAVPLKYKLDILLQQLSTAQVESVFRFVQELPRNSSTHSTLKGTINA